MERKVRSSRALECDRKTNRDVRFLILTSYESVRTLQSRGGEISTVSAKSALCQLAHRPLRVRVEDHAISVVRDSESSDADKELLALSRRSRELRWRRLLGTGVQCK